MNLNQSANDVISVQDAREAFIEEIAKSENKTEYVKRNAEALYSLGLTMYSRTFSFDSAIYNGLSVSRLNNRISLHPEQLRILDIIAEKRGTILSAPTSFGKTFTIFEYIAREMPKCIVLIVPTLALIDEYKRKIINEYTDVFSKYRVYLSIEKEREYNWDDYNIFIVTHDRVVNEEIRNIIKKIDFLVIDEVYKLQRDDSNDRVLILNLAYLNLVSISAKYVLLAPFISGIENLDKLDDKPFFYSTNYSPVVNDVITREVIDDSEKERHLEAKRLLNELEGNTLVYFPTVKALNNYILDDDSTFELENENHLLLEFIDWAKREIHEDWTVVKALENGFLVHHGQLPLGIRMLELDLFNTPNEYNKILCTSTLLEGINSDAENIIITKPARNNQNFDAFDFFNLVGRTGRLFKHYLGKAYYIQGPNDPEYVKSQALKTIEFELTTNSIDIDINKGEGDKYPQFNEFLIKIGIEYDVYKAEIASKCRFNTVVKLYESYVSYKQELLSEIEREIKNTTTGKLELVRVLYKIVEGKAGYYYKLRTFLINKFTYKTRISVHDAIEDARKWFSWYDLQDIIKSALNIKNSYIEYNYYKKILIVLMFMEAENIDFSYINFIREKLLKNIEQLYYINMPAHKMLKEMGVYEKDINTIIRTIGDNISSVEELKKKIINNSKEMNISIISRYVINRLIGY